MSAIDLARLEFSITASVHFLFAALTLGLLPVVAVLQTRWTVTGRPVLARMTKFWGNLYVINYALGIITGLVMEFQFGLNWSGLSSVAGNLFGAPLALETIVAFFAESTFLGLWILGWHRLPARIHLALIWLVTLTAYLSTFWVMVANGFLQHPVGYTMRGGVAVLTDWTALLTNPGAIEGLAHLVAGALCTGGFVVAGISAYHWARRSTDTEFWQRSLRTGLLLAAGGSLLTIGLGIPQYSYLKADQPAKLAAITGDAAGLARAQAAQQALHGPGNYVPSSWLVGPMDAMLVIGVLLAVLAVLGLMFGEQLVRSRAALWTLVGAIPLPFVALIAGWVVREEGRQPWAVYGLVRTDAAAGPVSFGAVLVSLIVFTAVYLALAALNYRLLARAARRGPHDALFGEPELVPVGG